jgi:hypothetical protein
MPWVVEDNAVAKKLTSAQIERLRAPGRHACGGGLYLQVTNAGSRSWLFRYQRFNKAHELGLWPSSLGTGFKF